MTVKNLAMEHELFSVEEISYGKIVRGIFNGSPVENHTVSA